MTEYLGGEAEGIMSEREDLGLIAICLGVVLLSAGGIVAAFATHLLPGLDGLLLLLICLMMIVIFSPPLLALARQRGWIPAGGKKKIFKEKEGEGKN